MALQSKKEYQELFDPKVYLRKSFTPLPNGEISDEEYQAWYLSMFHEFFSQFRSEFTNEARMLEFAGGPSVFSLISAATCVKEIVFSEFVDANREELKLWLYKKPEAFDWKPFFRHVLWKLEKLEGEDAVTAREDLVRSKISSVIPCDINGDPIVTGAEGLYNVVTCNNTLGPVSHSLEGYNENVKKLAAMLKPGGYLLAIQSWDGSFYGVGERSFHSLRITADNFEEAVKAAGLSIVMYKKKAAPEVVRDIPGNRKGMLFIAAKKSC